jgi:tRNA (guanine37-N1)-methyltransferase
MRTIVIVSLMHGPFMLFLKTGIIRRAINKKQLAIHLVDLRDFSNNKVVDDSVCGGKGMALKAPIIISAINHAQKTFFKHQPAKVIALSPQGKLLTQPTSTNHEYLLKNDIILLCGYYEGFDDRISHYIDGELSIGNYVLSNGEVAALVVCDVIARLLPNVINQESLLSESFTNSLLDYPVYTKPRI